MMHINVTMMNLDRLRAVPTFSLEFVEPRKDIVNARARKPRQGKTREARKIGTTDNLYCLKLSRPLLSPCRSRVTFNLISISCDAQITSS